MDLILTFGISFLIGFMVYFMMKHSYENGKVLGEMKGYTDCMIETQKVLKKLRDDIKKNEEKKKYEEKKTQKIRLFVYGTLKKGKALHTTYNFHKSDFICDDKVKGELYGLGWYPVLFETGKNVRFVPGEVYDLELDTFKTIKEMEEAAGYHTKQVKTANGHDAFVFYYDNEENRIPRNMIKEF